MESILALFEGLRRKDNTELSNAYQMQMEIINNPQTFPLLIQIASQASDSFILSQSINMMNIQISSGIQISPQDSIGFVTTILTSIKRIHEQNSINIFSKTISSLFSKFFQDAQFQVGIMSILLSFCSEDFLFSYELLYSSIVSSCSQVVNSFYKPILDLAQREFSKGIQFFKPAFTVFAAVGLCLQEGEERPDFSPFLQVLSQIVPEQHVQLIADVFGILIFHLNFESIIIPFEQLLPIIQKYLTSQIPDESKSLLLIYVGTAVQYSNLDPQVLLQLLSYSIDFSLRQSSAIESEDNLFLSLDFVAGGVFSVLSHQVLYDVVLKTFQNLTQVNDPIHILTALIIIQSALEIEYALFDDEAPVFFQFCMQALNVPNEMFQIQAYSALSSPLFIKVIKNSPGCIQNLLECSANGSTNAFSLLPTFITLIDFSLEEINQLPQTILTIIQDKPNNEQWLNIAVVILGAILAKKVLVNEILDIIVEFSGYLFNTSDEDLITRGYELLCSIVSNYPEYSLSHTQDILIRVMTGFGFNLPQVTSTLFYILSFLFKYRHTADLLAIIDQVLQTEENLVLSSGYLALIHIISTLVPERLQMASNVISQLLEIDLSQQSIEFIKNACALFSLIAFTNESLSDRIIQHLLDQLGSLEAVPCQEVIKLITFIYAKSPSKALEAPLLKEAIDLVDGVKNHHTGEFCYSKLFILGTIMKLFSTIAMKSDQKDQIIAATMPLVEQMREQPNFGLQCVALNFVKDVLPIDIGPYFPMAMNILSSSEDEQELTDASAAVFNFITFFNQLISADLYNFFKSKVDNCEMSLCVIAQIDMISHANSQSGPLDNPDELLAFLKELPIPSELARYNSTVWACIASHFHQRNQTTLPEFIRLFVDLFDCSKQQFVKKCLGKNILPCVLACMNTVIEILQTEPARFQVDQESQQRITSNLQYLHSMLGQ